MLFAKILALGNQDENQDWENTIIRKLNFLSLVGIANGIGAFVVCIPFGVYGLPKLFSLLFFFCPLVFYCNYKSNYKLATTIFFIMASGILFSALWMYGLGTMMYMYYCPALFILLFLVGRPELRKIMFWNSLHLTASLIAGIVAGMFYKQIELSEDHLQIFSVFCLAFSFISTLVLIVMSIVENLRLENSLRKTVHEKEILLAEVFHRVKNNMSIVTGLLSLKKDVALSEETKLALEDCRSRVYSMSTIHHLMMNSSELESLDFKLYIDEIVGNLNHTYGESVNIEMNSAPIEIPISQAVPCGLIINELITNAYKHARIPGKSLEIRVDIHLVDKHLTISVKDNGPGIKMESINTESHTLGFELIYSLCDQIDAELTIQNDNGCTIVFQFTKK